MVTYRNVLAPLVTDPTPGLIPLVLPRGVDHTRLRVVETASGEERPCTPLPSTWYHPSSADPDYSPCAVPVHTQVLPGDTGYRVETNPEQLGTLVDFDEDASTHWVEGALGRDFTVRLVTSGLGTYEARINEEFLDAEIESLGDAIVRVKLQGSLRKVGAPDSQIIGLGGSDFPEKYGFIEVYATYFGTLGQTRIQVRWTCGNTDDPEWACYFERLEVVLPGGLAYECSGVGFKDTGELSYEPNQTVKLIDRARYPSLDSLYNRPHGQFIGDIWLHPPTWSGPRKVYSWGMHEVSGRPEIPGFPFEKVSGFVQTKSEALQFCDGFLSALETDAPVESIPSWGKYNQDLLLRDPLSYRRMANGQGGGESGGRQIGPCQLVWLRQLEGPQVFETAWKILSRYVDRSASPLHDEDGTLMQAPDVYADGFDKLSLFQNQGQFALTTNAASALWDSAGINTDPYGFLNANQDKAAIASGLGPRNSAELGDLGFAQIDMQHWCRLIGPVSVLAVTYGDPVAHDILEGLAHLGMLEWAYGSPFQEGQAQLDQAPGSGPFGNRRQGWLGDGVGRAMACSKPGSDSRAYFESYAVNWVTGLLGAQFGSGGVNYFPGSTNKENTFAQARVPLAPGGQEVNDIRVTQSYQNMIIIHSLVFLVNQLDLWSAHADKTRLAWRWVYALAWNTAQSRRGPDYRVGVRDVETGEVFANRARIEQTYSSTIHIDCTVVEGCTPGDGNLTADFYVPMWLASGRILVDNGVIPPTELTQWEFEAFPAGIENENFGFGDIWMSPVGLGIK